MYNYFNVVTNGVFGSSADVVIDPVLNLRCTSSLGATKDTFSFKMPNSRGQNAKVLQPFYVVNIYNCINTNISDSTNLIMSGLVKTISEDKTDRSMLTIDGVSYGEVVTNALCFYAIPDNTTVNVMQFLEGCLNSVKFRDSIFKVEWDTNNPTTKTNGDSFPPLIGYREFDRPLNFLLDKYLVNDYTGDGNYYWYVSNDRKLVIRKRIQTKDASWVEGIDYKQAAFNISADDVKNFIVVKAGLDPANRTVTERYDDPVSRSQYGFKYFLLVEQNICSTLIESERQLHQSLYTASSNLPTNYTGYVTAWGVTINSESEYLNAFRVEAKRLAYIRGKSFADLHNRGFIQCKITRPPEKGFNVGNIIELTDSTFVYYNASTNLTKNLVNYPLRIVDIQYSINDVTYTLMEDLAIASN